MDSDDADREQEQRRLLLLAVEHSGITVGELWLHYFSIGGDAGEYEIDAFLHSSYSLPALQRDLLAHAVNELIDQKPPPPRAPYSSDAETRGSRELENEDRGDSGPPPQGSSR